MLSIRKRTALQDLVDRLRSDRAAGSVNLAGRLDAILDAPEGRVDAAIREHLVISDTQDFQSEVNFGKAVGHLLDGIRAQGEQAARDKELLLELWDLGCGRLR